MALAKHTGETASDRDHMVETQLAGRGVSQPRVLEAMRQVPRELFVSPEIAEFAYHDTPLPIAEGQTISQPYIVALMIEAAGVKPGDHVLDVGTGSGYAAAALSLIAAEVYTIERHQALADEAAGRLRRLGYRNVRVRHGDGTLGWPEKAPFDAIIVAAGGPEIPEALRNQLKIGGRLVIPIGALGKEQHLVRVVRDTEHAFHEDDLGPVQFVPLIGAQGWEERDVEKKDSGTWFRRAPAAQKDAAQLLREDAERLPDFNDPAFGKLFDRFAQARVVLLGEASHGTSEFYRARAAITRRLIEKHGFSIVAVEADWPDAATIDRYVRHKAGHLASEPAFRRFPIWMWRNAEVRDFVDWMRAENACRAAADRAGFFGLDIYNMQASVRAAIDFLDKTAPTRAAAARGHARAQDACGGTRALRRPDALAARCCELRPRGDHIRLCEVRSRRGCDAARSFGKENGVRGTRQRRLLRCDAECAPCRQRGALLPRHVLWRRGVVESTRPPYVRDAATASAMAGEECEGGGMGAQFAYRQCGGDGDGTAARRIQHRSVVPGRVRERSRADRFRYRPRNRGGSIRL